MGYSWFQNLWCSNLVSQEARTVQHQLKEFYPGNCKTQLKAAAAIIIVSLKTKQKENRRSGRATESEQFFSQNLLLAWHLERHVTQIVNVSKFSTNIDEDLNPPSLNFNSVEIPFKAFKSIIFNDLA